MKQRIAIPIVNGLLSAHFGHCEYFALFDAEEKEITGETKVVPPPHEPGILPPWLAEQGANVIIAGGMGQRAIQLFEQNNIRVCLGGPQKTAREIAQEYLDGKLETGKNMCDH